MRELVHKGSFYAWSHDGHEFLINILQDLFVSQTSNGTTRTLGNSQLRTKNGDLVNVIERGKYEVVSDAGELIEVFSDEPEAP